MLIKLLLFFLFFLNLPRRLHLNRLNIDGTKCHDVDGPMPVDRRGWPTLRALANLLNCHRLSVNSLQHLKMPKSNPNFPYLSSSNPPGNLFMDSNQLVDSLTAHISLYHNRSPSSSPNPNPNPRSSILKWFSSLTVQQRHSYISSSATLTFQR